MSYVPRTDPKTKADLLNRMLQVDFSGDLHDLGADRLVEIRRQSEQSLLLTFPTSGRQYEVIIRCPKSEKAKEALRKSWYKRHPAKAKTTEAKPTKRKAA